MTWPRLWFPEATQLDVMRRLLDDSGPGGLTPEDDARRRVRVVYGQADEAKVHMRRGAIPRGQGALWFSRR